VPRRVLDPGPFTFAELELPHASDHDIEIAQRVAAKFFPGVELRFGLVAVPTFELIESSQVDAAIRGEFPVDVYQDWRCRGAPEAEARELFARADAAQRASPAFEAELPIVEQLERLLAENAAIDPLIARSLEQPLSTGEQALFIIDGRHRLLAAASTGVAELEVYIGRPSPGGRR
jgi:hypothetical protein